MSDTVFFSFGETLKILYNFLLSIALPLAIIVGAGIVAFSVRGSVLSKDGLDLTKTFRRVFGYLVAAIFVVCGWMGLKNLEPLAASQINRKEAAKTSEEPVIRAPQIDQAGPVAAAMIDKTYRRTLTLPPDFYERIGVDGVGVLSPYLVDPTAENVKSLVDSFRRSGQDVVFSRELTRTDESPIPFDSSDINVQFKRIQRRAYQVDFDAEYLFTNHTDSLIEGRFLFYPPRSGGMIQGLRVEVDGERIDEPDKSGYYLWLGDVGPGEQKRATVSYESIGTSNWSYHVGSARRRVRDFRLTADVDGPVEFRAGTINPSSRDDKKIEWRLDDVLTSQRLGLVFPEDVKARDAFLNGVGSVPVTMVLMLMALVVAGMRGVRPISPKRLALATVTTVLGLGSSAVLFEHLGYTASLFIGSVIAAAVTAFAADRRSLALLMPVALLPASSLAQEKADVWILVLAALAIGLLLSPLYKPKAAE